MSMYNNYGMNSYLAQQQDYSNSLQNRLSTLQGGYMARQEIIRVNGENGARAYNMPPNSSTLLLDENMPIVWLAQTDGAGYKTVVPYSITPYQNPSEPDYSSLESRIRKLEEAFNESNFKNDAEKRSNDKSNKPNGK